MSMARLWRDQWKPQQLAKCSLRFMAGSPKGSTKRDLKEAKALLDALSPPPDAPLTSKDAT